MTDAPRRPFWKRKRWIAVSFAILLLVSYPFSLGPATYAETRGWVSLEVMDIIYGPMYWGQGPDPGGGNFYPVPWWPKWYREEYIGRFEAAGIEDYYAADPAYQAELRAIDAEWEARRTETADTEISREERSPHSD